MRFFEIWLRGVAQLLGFGFKGQTVAVSMAKAMGVTRIAIPTAGNAGAGLAAYATRAGIESFVFNPSYTP